MSYREMETGDSVGGNRIRAACRSAYNFLSFERDRLDWEVKLAKEELQRRPDDPDMLQVLEENKQERAGLEESWQNSTMRAAFKSRIDTDKQFAAGSRKTIRNSINLSSPYYCSLFGIHYCYLIIDRT